MMQYRRKESKKSRIQASLSRIWQAKQQLFNTPTPNTELFSDRAESSVSAILQDSLQRNKATITADSQAGRNLIVVDDVLNAAYLDLNSPAIAIPQKYNYQRQLVDRQTLDCILLSDCPTLLQIFIRGNPFRGNAGLTARSKKIYQQLLESKNVVGVAIYGSPYVLEWFQTIMDSDLPWVFSYGQMEQSQAIALQTLFAIDPLTLESKSRDFGF